MGMDIEHDLDADFSDQARQTPKQKVVPKHKRLDALPQETIDLPEGTVGYCDDYDAHTK